MKLDTTEKSLPVYEALASSVRLKMINLLSEKPMNLKEMAESLSLSSAILSMHVRKLENAGIIRCERVHRNGSVSKICSLEVVAIAIEFPSKDKTTKIREFSLPVGHYTDFNISPTCGIATGEHLIGYFDEPRYFLDPERVSAKVLWFTKGYVEYKLPNLTLGDETLKSVEISLELGSEAPGVNTNWPSDISFHLNQMHIGDWTSPGDFGGTRGKYTPDWWSLEVGQYGLLKLLRIDESGSYIDGIRVSDVRLSQISPKFPQWTFRIGVREDAKHPGGATIFGAGFGNYNQDILFRFYYE